nr:hypothetical protein [Tanacetum cinerariifolium]
MSNLSHNRNKSLRNDECDDTRVVEDDPVVKIRENSSMMDKGGIEDGEMVDEDGGVVSDKSAHGYIEKLDMEKNKGVFGCADKESDDCNIVFGSMCKNDVTNDVSNVNKPNNESFAKSYARTAERIELNKNLFSIPTGIKENEDEVVVFNEEIVEEGSKKWVNTVCGYFVGCNMSPVELRNSQGLNTIVDQSPWMVNGKPLMLFNIPLEAWSVKEISALASMLGKPLVMDDMTASICHNEAGRSAFTRVLVEIEAVKGFKDLIEIQYKDKSNNVIRTKFMKVEFSWKPISCSHCNVFGYNDTRAGNNKGKEQTKESITINGRGEVNAKVQYKYVPKNDGNKENMKPEMNKQMKDSQFKTSTQSPFKKSYNVGKNIEELRISANTYSVLTNEESNEEISKEFMDRRLEVDRMSNQSDCETKDDLVFKENEAAKNLVAGELDGVDTEPLESVEIIFDKVLSKDEAEDMISLVSNEEIKEVAFDIDSNKASGPDGYTSQFFKKAWHIVGRGLRQGDPISSYLFTLVMEVFSLLLSNNIQKAGKFKYHHGFKELKLFNMCFTDDLLVLCNGDVDSVGVIKQIID